MIQQIRDDLADCERRAAEICVKPSAIWEDYDTIKELVEYIGSLERALDRLSEED